MEKHKVEEKIKMNLIESLESEYMKSRDDIPDFGPGDRVRVHIRIVEGDKERTQTFEGTVIRRANKGLSETFTVRRISFGVGIERTFLLHSPRIEKIEVVRYGSVRQAKLYYLRGRTGKSARIRERRRQ